MSKAVPFRYVAKASRSERDRGCEHLHYKQVEGKWVLISKDEHDALEAQGERVTSGNVHSTVKPIEVMEWLISELSEPGDTILEPFGGSGTTAIAAMRQGRNCHIIELDEDGIYSEIIRGRLLAHKKDIYDKALPHERVDIELGGEIEDDPEEEAPEPISVFDFL
jgi:hypothetical protein